MNENSFDPEMLYNRIVHFYIDKKKYSKEKANEIARAVITRETNRKKCKNQKCGHKLEDHIGKTETCLVLSCDCKKFLK